MCFGIELTMNNVAAKYFYTYHGLSPQISGLCASMWGMMNLICRSMGGWLSDWANNKGGMRGRLWACWIVQTIEGVLCIFLGLTTTGYDAPHSSSVGGTIIGSWGNLGNDPIRAQLGMPNGWIDLNATYHANNCTFDRDAYTNFRESPPKFTNPAHDQGVRDLQHQDRRGPPLVPLARRRRQAGPPPDRPAAVRAGPQLRLERQRRRPGHAPRHLLLALRPDGGGPPLRHRAVRLARRPRRLLGHGRCRRQRRRGHRQLDLLHRRLPHGRRHHRHGRHDHRRHRPHVLRLLPRPRLDAHQAGRLRLVRPAGHQAAGGLPWRRL